MVLFELTVSMRSVLYGCSGGVNKRSCSSAKACSTVCPAFALMRHLIAPLAGLAIAFGQGSERPAGPKGVAHIADGSLHASFLIAGAHLTGLGREMVMATEFEQAGIEMNL